MEKIGVVIPSQNDLDKLFRYYDTDGSGALDYKEFTGILLNKDAPVTEKKNQQFG